MKFDYEKQKKTLVVLALIFAAGCVAYLLVYKLASYIVPFVMALIFTALISPIVDILERKIKINRKLLSLVVIILSFCLLGGILYFIVSEIYNSCKDYIAAIINNAPEFYDKITGLDIISGHLENIFHTEINLVEMIKNIVLSFSQNVVEMVTNFAKKLPQFFVASVVFILATYFMVSDKDKILELLFSRKNKNIQLAVDKAKYIFRHSVVKYIRAQAIILCITFCELLLGFSILKFLNIIDINHIFIIALGIASLDALPVFGTGTILIPWSLYGILIGDFKMAISTVLMYIICLVVRQFTEPKIVSQSLGIHPLITLICMYIGLKTIGILGMISFPILAVFVISFYKLFQELKNEIETE